MEISGLLKSVESLSMAEFLNFYELSQLLSIRELARRKSQNPSRISRSLSQLEAAIGKPLMIRNPSGMTLTEEGQKLQGILQKLLDVAEGLSTSARGGGQLTLGSNSFLSNRLVAINLGDISKVYPDIRVIDFPPDELVTSGIKGAFDVCMHLGSLDWPQSWESRQIGEISWILCARKDHPLQSRKKIELEDVLEYPFIFPMYWAKSGVAIGDDYFPVSIFKRKRGFGTSTAEAGVVMLRNSDQIGFLPDITVYNEVDNGFVKIIGEDKFRSPKPLFMTVRTDRITQKNFDFLSKQFSNSLKELQTRD